MTFKNAQLNSNFKPLLKALELTNQICDLDGYGFTKKWKVKLDKTKTNIELYNDYQIKDTGGEPDCKAEFKVKIPLDNPPDYKIIPLTNRYKFEKYKINSYIDGLLTIKLSNN